jgi:hypothetical protein
MGGDEINIPEAGKNYGWPVITYGRNYNGAKIGVGTARRRGWSSRCMYWDPSIAPSGLMFYAGNGLPRSWTGSLFVGALAGSLIARLYAGRQQDCGGGASALRARPPLQGYPSGSGRADLSAHRRRQRADPAAESRRAEAQGLRARSASLRRS